MRATIICAPDCVTENVLLYGSLALSVTEAQLLLLTVVGHANAAELIVTVFVPPASLLPTMAKEHADTQRDSRHAHSYIGACVLCTCARVNTTRTRES